MLNRAVLRLRDDGTMDTFKRHWFTDLNACDDSPDKPPKITVHQVAGLFYMVLVFAAIAVVWALGERLAIKCFQVHGQQLIGFAVDCAIRSAHRVLLWYAVYNRPTLAAIS